MPISGAVLMVEVWDKDVVTAGHFRHATYDMLWSGGVTGTCMFADV